MKSVLLISIILLLNSCLTILTINNKEITNKKTASTVVITKINFIEKQFIRYQKGKKANFSDIEDIVNLSNIIPVNHSGNWSGAVYFPNNKIIEKWKKWYIDNKDSFYFEPNNDCLLKLHLTKKMRDNVIFIKINDSLIRTSASLQNLCRTSL